MDTFLRGVLNFLFFTGLIALLRKRLTKWASFSGLLALMLTAAFSMYSGDGLHDIAIIIYPAVILFRAFGFLFYHFRKAWRYHEPGVEPQSWF